MNNHIQKELAPDELILLVLHLLGRNFVNLALVLHDVFDIGGLVLALAVHKGHGGRLCLRNAGLGAFEAWEVLGSQERLSLLVPLEFVARRVTHSMLGLVQRLFL